MLLALRIATSLLVMAASTAELLALPRPCDDGVTMSGPEGSGCGSTCACCPETCACAISPKAPAPESSQPALLTPATGPSLVRDVGCVAAHPGFQALEDGIRAVQPLDRFAPTAGPRRTERTLELFCTLLV